MVQESVVAVFSTFSAAQHAVQTLEAAGFPADKISLVTHSVNRQVSEKETLQSGDETEHNAAKGAGIGGVIGLLLGAPLLAIPGIGPVLVAGPLAAGMTGALVGGFLGAMSGWGVHEDHVRQYQEQVRGGSMLVVAQGDPQEVAFAKGILDQSHAEEVHLHAPTGDDSPEIDDRSVVH